MNRNILISNSQNIKFRERKGLGGKFKLVIPILYSHLIRLGKQVEEDE